MSGLYRLGVDGGGSRCRVRLCSADGQVLADAEGGPANVYLDFAGATATVEDLTARVFTSAGLAASARERTRAGLGLAGVSSRPIATRVETALPGFACIHVDHDGVAACLGAHAGQDGGIVIAGTGSAAVLRRGDRIASFGGRGFLLGDDGSGAWIGREVWRRTLRVADGLEPSSRFADTLLDTFGRDPVAVIGWARHASSRDFAAYAPRVFEAAARGDPMAATVVRAAAAALAELIEALAQRGAPRISLVGGMAASVEPYLPSAVGHRLKPAVADALSGALLMAERCGTPRD